ncbi:Rho GTPase activating protein, putative [Pediculus humanus corporis]|uniref:Rho GTPase activating protein, putative n=1 Tax=Pediculus humanus subsp. corporis TaxID=121224 RepID=E0VUJ1_PEDHC|nr:Rho GTPase activating protein, putative [Pediculus humanus corporis]EEB17047.1 Rho GTPase activating protein, putative [Pediculus humanus corporis]
MVNLLSNDVILLSEKLRNEDPEQFYTLVKMHLSFVLDLNTDECDNNTEKKSKAVKWNLPFTKKQKVNDKNSLDGPPLTYDFITQMKPIIEFLRKEENICQEGIFRRSGRVTRQQELKLLLHQGITLNFDENQFSVHECATVLKNVLSELPESVLTDAQYPAYCQIAELCNVKNHSYNERLLRALQLLILLLPNENRIFFKEIIELLNLAVAHEHKNRMSAENLATLFTPHLLCPRKLSPEALHVNSQVMSGVVAFMIQMGSKIFDIPPTVATDVKAYWNKKEKRINSPLKQMNESICDGTAANTVFTFVDREKTAEENRTNPTVTALAQLYAYIQALPESSKKRKLIKQFNKENGYGTPLRNTVNKKRLKPLNLGDSIKSPDSGMCCKKFTKEEEEEEQLLINGSGALNNKSPLSTKIIHAKNGDTRKTFLNGEQQIVKVSNIKNDFQLNKEMCHHQEGSSGHNREKDSRENSLENTPKYNSKRSLSSLSKDDIILSKTSRLSEEKKFSEGSSSTGGSDGGNLSFVSNKNYVKFKCFSKNKLNSLEMSTKEEEEKKEERDFDDEFSVRKLNNSNVVSGTNNNEGFLHFSINNNTNRLPISYCPKSTYLMTTSTPAPTSTCFFTPKVDKNNSMSPITKSARRMPKAMQETMMTPRSRKPVISLSGTDLCSLVNSDSGGMDLGESDETKSKILNNKMGKKLIMEEDSTNERDGDSLSSPFRNYLYSRSVLTASPVDLSFSSRADDFLSLTDDDDDDDDDDNSSKENYYNRLPEIINRGGGGGGGDLSESLLYCLDGNEPNDGHFDKNEKEYNCSCSSSYSDSLNSQVYETAL